MTPKPSCLYCDRIIRARGLCTLHYNRWQNRLPMEARKDYHKPNKGWVHEGYRWICLPNGQEVREHRWLMEQYLGRKLHINEVVHHINGIKTDNKLENLEVKLRDIHTKDHLKQTPVERVCGICGKTFMKPSEENYKIYKSCSIKCRSVQIWRTRHAS